MNRRIGVVRLNADDLVSMLVLPEGHGVAAVGADWDTDSVVIKIEGPTMPECSPGTYPMRVEIDRFYDPRLRQKLTYLVERWDDDVHGRRAQDVVATLAAVLDGEMNPTWDMSETTPRVVTADVKGGIV